MSEKLQPRRLVFSGETIELRMGVEQDIDAILGYWYGMDQTVLSGMGVEPQRMPPRSEFHRLYVQMVRSLPESSDAFFLVIDSPTRGLLGYALFNRFQRPEHCDGHAHLFHTYDKPAVGIVGAMRVNRYEITPEMVFRSAPQELAGEGVEGLVPTPRLLRIV